MKKNRLFKFGAGLTAALMVCGSVGMVAFADEDNDAKDAAPETGIVDVVDNDTTDPAEPADPADEIADPEATPVPEATPAPEDEATPAPEAPAEPEESAVPDATIPAEVVTPAPEVLGADAPTDETTPTIAVDTIKKTSNNVIKVSLTVTNKVAIESTTQMTLFAYDITGVGTDTGTGFDDTVDPETGKIATPVMHIDQNDVAEKVEFSVLIKDLPNDTIDETTVANLPLVLLKIGGTDVTRPGAALLDLKNVDLTPSADIEYGNVNGDHEEDDDGNQVPLIDMKDVNLVLQAYKGKVTLTDDQILAANVNGDTEEDDNGNQVQLIDMKDVNLILQRYKGKINQFPIEESN